MKGCANCMILFELIDICNDFLTIPYCFCRGPTSFDWATSTRLLWLHPQNQDYRAGTGSPLSHVHQERTRTFCSRDCFSFSEVNRPSASLLRQVSRSRTKCQGQISSASISSTKCQQVMDQVEIYFCKEAKNCSICVNFLIWCSICNWFRRHMIVDSLNVHVKSTAAFQLLISPPGKLVFFSVVVFLSEFSREQNLLQPVVCTLLTEWFPSTLDTFHVSLLSFVFWQT